MNLAVFESVATHAILNTEFEGAKPARSTSREVLQSDLQFVLARVVKAGAEVAVIIRLNGT